MSSAVGNWRQSPTLIRVVPFLVFLALTAAQGQLGESSRYWLYLLKTLAGASLIWVTWPFVKEMRFRWTWDALVIGIVVFALWIGLDGLYPSVDALFRAVGCPWAKWLGLEHWCATPPKAAPPWNPHTQFGPAAAWGFVCVRLVGSSLVVPGLEEVFYRSFLYRFIAEPKFETLPLNHVAWPSFLMTSAIFGFSHFEWLPGILCGMLYQSLVLCHNRLGDAMTAHAITNFLLGLWIVWKGAWHFW